MNGSKLNERENHTIQMKGESAIGERQGGWRKPFGKRGQTFVEFAFMASAFLLLSFSIMWVSLAVSDYNHVSYAAREGSRYAAVHGTDSKQPVTTASAVTTFVQTKTAGLDSSKLTVSTTWTPAATPGRLAARSKSRSSISFNFQFP